MLNTLFRKINGLETHHISGGADVVSMPSPQAVRLDRRGYVLTEGLKKKSEVFPYMRLGTFVAEGVGDLFSPIQGTITNITDSMIEITAGETKGGEPEKWFPKLDGLPASGLATALNRLGITTESFAVHCSVMIISAIDPDPALTWSEALLAGEKDVVDAGFALLKRLTPAKKYVFAVPKGCNSALDGAERVEIKDALYPAGVDEMVIAAVSGIEAPVGYKVIHLHDLWKMGRVAMTGLPLIETIVTVGDTEKSVHIRAAIGTPLSALLEKAHVGLGTGNALLRNGELRGSPVSSADIGLSETTTGVCVRSSGTRVSFSGDGPCVNCGACAEVCPARLEPGRLSRFAEMGMVEDCQKENIQVCFECGLCTYVCTSRRPVLQYLRMVKRHLACSLPEWRIQNGDEN